MIPKFRAWDKKKERMIEWIDLDFSKDNGEDFIIVFEPTGIVRDAIISPILLQSTGLFDRNGKEIYEGDIVKHDPVPNPFISNAYFEIIQARSGEWRMDNYKGGQVLAYGNHEVEVVGNKFEHQHLLEEE